MAASEPSPKERIASLLQETDGTGILPDSQPELEETPKPQESLDAEAPEEETEAPEETPGEQEGEATPEGETEPEEIPIYQFKVAGEEKEVGLDELVRVYQQTEGSKSSLDKRHSELNASKAQFELERQQIQAQGQQQIQALSSLIEQVQQQVLVEEPRQLDELRKSGEITTEEYVAKKLELQERKELTEKAKLEAQQAYQRQIEAQRPYENAALLQKVPEWADASKRDPESKEVQEELQGFYGIQPEIVNQLSNDHRFVAMAIHATRYRRLVQSKSEVVKKVQRLPKVVKPGAKAAKGHDADVDITKAREKLRKTGTREDAAALLGRVIKRQQRKEGSRGAEV